MKNKGKDQAFDSLFILDEETIFLTSNLKIKKSIILKSRDEFDAFINKSFEVKNIIILVELGWDNSVSQFHGYQVTKELMNSCNRKSNFNLLFISTLKREAIYETLRNKNRIFTQKFKHELITKDFDLNKANVPIISTKKFDYLKNYCLLESGVIDRLEHDIRNLLGNPDEARLKKVIEEIKANKDILSTEIIDITENLEKLTDLEAQKKLIGIIHSSLQYLQKQINNPDDSSDKKSHAKVLLIEDDASTNRKLQIQLGGYFKSITPFLTGSDAFFELQRNALQYDVVITDMELLDGNFDDEKQGVDILELCENDYPFIVTRVITALPKNALKKLIGKEVGEIVFKSGLGDSVIPPFENMIEFVKQIDIDVQKRKQLRKMQGPVLSWWGKYLTQKVYLTKIEEPEKIELIWDNARVNAMRFINGEFDSSKNSDKLSAEFKRVNDPANKPELGWEIIELLLTHRLIAFWFAAQKSWDEFYYSGNGEDVYTNLNGFQDSIKKRTYKAYYNTFLGISYKKIPKNPHKCQVIPMNLFPEEIEWLSQNTKTNFESIPLYEINSDCNDVFLQLMKTYYTRDINDDVTVGETIQYLDKFIADYSEGRCDPTKLNSLNSIFDNEVYNYETSLPKELKARLDRVKNEILKISLNN